MTENAKNDLGADAAAGAGAGSSAPDQLTHAAPTFTPGPWKAGRADMATIVDGFDSKWIYGPGEVEDCRYIAVASGRECEWPEVMANAHLIASAPDLYAALTALALLAYAPTDARVWNRTLGDIRQQVEAALAKAEGRTP